MNIDINDINMFKLIPSDYLKFNLIQNNYRSSIIIKNISDFDIFVHLEDIQGISFQNNNYRIERNENKRFIIESEWNNLIDLEKITLYLKILEPNKIFLKNMKQNFENIEIYDYILQYDFQIVNNENSHKKPLNLKICGQNFHSIESDNFNEKVDKSINCNLNNTLNFNLDISNIHNEIQIAYPNNLNNNSLVNLDLQNKEKEINNLEKTPKINTNEDLSYNSLIDKQSIFKNDPNFSRLQEFLNKKSQSKIFSEIEFNKKFYSKNSSSIVRNRIKENLKSSLSFKSVNNTNIEQTNINIDKIKNNIFRKNRFKQIIFITVSIVILFIILYFK